jgi:hypothetical protein
MGAGEFGELGKLGEFVTWAKSVNFEILANSVNSALLVISDTENIPSEPVKVMR